MCLYYNVCFCAAKINDSTAQQCTFSYGILFTSPQITRAGHASVSRYTVSSSASAGDTRISPGTYSYIHVTQHVACVSSSVKFSVHVNKPLCRYQSWSSVKFLNALAQKFHLFQNTLSNIFNKLRTFPCHVSAFFQLVKM